MNAKAISTTKLPSRHAMAVSAYARRRSCLRTKPQFSDPFAVVNGMDLSTTTLLDHDCLCEKFRTIFGPTLAENAGQIRSGKAQIAPATNSIVVVAIGAALAERAKDCKPRLTDCRSGVIREYGLTGEWSRDGAVTHSSGAKEAHCHADF